MGENRFSCNISICSSFLNFKDQRVCFCDSLSVFIWHYENDFYYGWHCGINVCYQQQKKKRKEKRKKSSVHYQLCPPNRSPTGWTWVLLQSVSEIVESLTRLWVSCFCNLPSLISVGPKCYHKVLRVREFIKIWNGYQLIIPNDNSRPALQVLMSLLKPNELMKFWFWDSTSRWASKLLYILCTYKFIRKNNSALIFEERIF